MKLRTLLVAAAINSALLAPASLASDPFNELEQAVEDMNSTHEAEFDEWYEAHLAEYTRWQTEYLKKWDKETDGALKNWQSHKTDSATTLVINDPELAARTVIDLEKGEITISHNVEKSTLSTSEVMQQVVEKNTALFKEMGVETVPVKVPKQEIKQREFAKPEVLVAELTEVINQQTERQMSQLDQVAEAIISDQEKAQAVVEKEKKKMRLLQEARIAAATKSVEKSSVSFQRTSGRVMDYSMNMPSSSMNKRAQTFMPYVQRESDRHNIEQSLILAIMHTESHFNPKAKSHVPAYGLMQIVPTTAGHDVNKLKRGKNKPMTAKELYVPGVNVETGVAYLDILRNRYLRGIKHPESADYAVIAAYNTGSGNVAKAFGERSVRAAVEKINLLSPEEVYNTLLTKLPYDETKNYVRKVREKMSEYQKYESYSSI